LTLVTAVGVVFAQEIRLDASMPVNVGMAAGIQQSHVLIVVPFCENNAQIMVDCYRPFSAHLARKSMIAQRGIEGMLLEQLNHMNHRCLVSCGQIPERSGKLF
jgi:hypothetical protein